MVSAGGDTEHLTDKIIAIGAELKKPKRLIQDLTFSQPKKPAKAGDSRQQNSLGLEVDLTDFKVSDKYQDLENLIGLLNLLGLKNLWRLENKILADVGHLERKNCRLRKDGDEISFDVKEPRQKEQAYDKRSERSVKALNPEGVKALMRKLGYTKENTSEKMRTTFQKGNCLIEINEGPFEGVPPWIEIEGPEIAEILKVARELGYSEGDFSAISDRKYYMNHGIGKERLSNISFGTFIEENK